MKLFKCKKDLAFCDFFFLNGVSLHVMLRNEYVSAASFCSTIVIDRALSERCVVIAAIEWQHSCMLSTYKIATKTSAAAWYDVLQ